MERKNEYELADVVTMVNNILPVQTDIIVNQIRESLSDVGARCESAIENKCSMHWTTHMNKYFPRPIY